MWSSALMSKFHATACSDNVLHRFCELLPRGWHWRRSPLGPQQVLLTLMQMTAFGTHGYRTAMENLFEQIGKPLEWDAVPSTAAFTQARPKLTAGMLRTLFADVSATTSHVGSHAQLRCRGVKRLIAADGSKLPLVSRGRNKQDFGCPSGDHLAPQALITVLWDLGGNAPIDWRVGRFDESETDHLQHMLGSLQAGDVLIADRLYPSRALMIQLLDRGRDFIFRLKAGTTALSEIKDFLASEDQERVITLHGENPRKVRVVRGCCQESKHVILVTSLLDQDLHSAELIADLYQRRWGIETAYREGKDWLALSNLPGQSNDQIQQEVAALMIYWLMQAELEGQARRVYAKEIAAQRKLDPQHRPAEGITELPVRFNRRLGAEVVAGVLRRSMISREEALRVWRGGLDYMWRNRSRRKPGRSYRRTSERPHDLKMRDEQARAKARGGRASGAG